MQDNSNISSTDLVNTLMNAGQSIADSSTSDDYDTFRQQVIAAQASIRQQQIQMGVQEEGYQNAKAQDRAQVATQNYNNQNSFLAQDYNTYVGALNTSRVYQAQAAQIDITSYLTNAKNTMNSALYGMSQGLARVGAMADQARSYFSGSQADVNSGSARDVQASIIDQGSIGVQQDFVGKVNQVNSFIAEASKTQFNLQVSQMNQNEQAYMMQLRTQRQLSNNTGIGTGGMPGSGGTGGGYIGNTGSLGSY